MVERRLCIRVECELTGSFRDLDSGSPGHIESAVIKNISRGGLKLLVNDFIPIQDRLFVYLHLPSHQTIEVQVSPAWIVEVPHLNKYEVGARFVGIREEDESAIENFQYQALLEKMPSRTELVKDLLRRPEKGPGID